MNQLKGILKLIQANVCCRGNMPLVQISNNCVIIKRKKKEISLTYITHWYIQRSKRIIYSSLSGIDVCRSFQSYRLLQNKMLTTAMVGNDCTLKKSGLTSVPRKGLQFLFHIWHLPVLLKDYQITVDVVSDGTEGDYGSSNRPWVICEIYSGQRSTSLW